MQCLGWGWWSRRTSSSMGSWRRRRTGGGRRRRRSGSPSLDRPRGRSDPRAGKRCPPRPSLPCLLEVLWVSCQFKGEEGNIGRPPIPFSVHRVVSHAFPEKQKRTTNVSLLLSEGRAGFPLWLLQLFPCGFSAFAFGSKGHPSGFRLFHHRRWCSHDCYATSISLAALQWIAVCFSVHCPLRATPWIQPAGQVFHIFAIFCNSCNVPELLTIFSIFLPFRINLKWKAQWGPGIPGLVHKQGVAYLQSGQKLQEAKPPQLTNSP